MRAGKSSRRFTGLLHGLLLYALLFQLWSVLEARTAMAATAKPYEHFLVGTATNVKVPASALPRVVLMGGGPAVEDAFRWMIRKGGGGNFVVIRAAGTDAYNSYIHELGGVSSVETLVVPSREAADDPFVARRIRSANALLIAGGDQSDYVRYWKGSRLEKEVNRLARKGVPIAGASAGLAILGQYAFSAERGSLRSTAALANPFHESITFSEDFLRLPGMENLITDSHFDSPNRIGRLIVFMSRLTMRPRASPVRGVGVAAGTALMIENGKGEIAGTGAVHFLEMTSPPEVAVPDTPLSHREIRVEKLEGAGQFDLKRWTGIADSTVRYSVSVVEGRVLSSRTDGEPY